MPISAAGLRIEHNVATDRQILGSLVFDDVAALQTVGAVGQGMEVAKFAVDRIQLGGSALVLGCCTTATKMAASYTNEREQFGRPLSTYQGAQLRAADCVIDTHGIRLTLLQAAWRLDQGLDADDAIAVAKYWSAEAGQRVVHNTQHLHGGMGADVDYPVHRTFLWVKQLECTFGAGSQQLARLGASIAAAAVG